MRTIPNKREWLKAAEAFGKGDEGGLTGRLSRGTYSGGLCSYFLSRRESVDVFDGMYRFLGDYFAAPSRSSPYWTPEADDLRVLIACLFAAMTQKERKEVLAHP